MKKIGYLICLGFVLVLFNLNSSAQDLSELQWVDAANGQSPADALIVAYIDGEPIAICHADYNGGVHPGPLVNNGCQISYGGSAFIEPTYQVLTGQATTIWETSSGSYSDAYVPVPGGFENDHPLYICRANYLGSRYIGKVVDDNCDFALGSKEIYVKDFEVLFAYAG